MQNDLATIENENALALNKEAIEPILENGANGNGNRALLPTGKLPISKQISNDHLIAEEKFLIERETEVERNYEGLRGYLRLFHVSRMWSQGELSGIPRAGG